MQDRASKLFILKEKNVLNFRLFRISVCVCFLLHRIFFASMH